MRIETKKEAGQTLVEMLIAISIVVIAILGILVLVNRSLGLNRVTTEFYIATYLASEGIELTKNLFDRSFIKATPGSQNFYGWVLGNNIFPISQNQQPPKYGVYQIDYSDDELTAVPCGQFQGVPQDSEVRKIFFEYKCGDFLKFDSNKGIYSYDAGGALKTKFRRVVIIDKPSEFSSAPVNLDYRVTSAVGWESRGGKFAVQLQDHFLPWRLP